jgi:hypothetical protein
LPVALRRIKPRSDPDVVWGNGVGNVAGVLADVRRQGFQGNV